MRVQCVFLILLTRERGYTAKMSKKLAHLNSERGDGKFQVPSGLINFLISSILSSISDVSFTMDLQ
jgi:hypothetical protein